MTKKKLLADIVRDPSHFYRLPADVLRDRRFNNAERVIILRAWGDADKDRADEIGAALLELEERGLDHAAE